MKTISGQRYGYSYELDRTSETDGTTCYAVDTGTVFVAYHGVWYEQPVYWLNGVPGDSDLYGNSWALPNASALDDLIRFNAYDSGASYIVYNGAWYKQPVRWADPNASSGGGGGGGGADVLICDFNIAAGENTCTATFAEVQAAIAAGKHIISQARAYVFPGVVANAAYFVSETDDEEDCVRFVFAYTTSSGSGTSTTYFYAKYKASGITIGMFG
jgi:hypothetical protein